MWIPGTRHVVIVDDDDDSDEGRLTRLDVDDRSAQDLGAVRGGVGMTVSPDATRLFVTHGGPDSDRGNEIEISNGSASRPVQETLAASEVIVLETGERTAVSDEPSIWAEWAPDGSALAVLQPVSQGARWLIADERRLRELGTMQATPTFLRNYLFFSWQYVESPRIWAPDADAIVYAAVEAGIPGIYVHPLTGERVRVSDGDVAFFALDPTVPPSRPPEVTVVQSKTITERATSPADIAANASLMSSRPTRAVTMSSRWSLPPR